MILLNSKQCHVYSDSWTWVSHPGEMEKGICDVTVTYSGKY